MKKIFLIIIVLLISGCTSKNIITCEIDVNNNQQGYKLNSIYKIHYKKNFVTKIEKNDIYTSDNEEILIYLNNYKNLEYENLSSLYGGYIFDIGYTKGKVEINAIINSKELNVKQMLIDSYIDEDYVVNNKITKSGIIKIYESQGAICK